MRHQCRDRSRTWLSRNWFSFISSKNLNCSTPFCHPQRKRKEAVPEVTVSRSGKNPHNRNMVSKKISVVNPINQAARLRDLLPQRSSAAIHQAVEGDDIGWEAPKRQGPAGISGISSKIFLVTTGKSQDGIGKYGASILIPNIFGLPDHEHPTWNFKL